MKIGFFKILAVFLALMVFVSTTGLSVNMHYCQGALMSASLFSQARSCHKAMSSMDNQGHCAKMTSSCSGENIENGICRKGCCDNKSFKVQMDQDLISAESATPDRQAQLEIYCHVPCPDVFPDQELFTVTDRFPYHKPPPLVADIMVLHQSFLL